MRNLFLFFVSLIICMSSGNVNAGITDFSLPNLGYNDSVNFGVNSFSETGHFTHNWSFTAKDSSLSAIYINFNSGLFDIYFESGKLLNSEGKILAESRYIANEYFPELDMWKLESYLVGAGSYILQISGNAYYTSSSYSGQITAENISQVVPVPGAILLFGSGLLGLVGLRRRQIV